MTTHGSIHGLTRGSTVPADPRTAAPALRAQAPAASGEDRPRPAAVHRAYERPRCEPAHGACGGSRRTRTGLGIVFAGLGRLRNSDDGDDWLLPGHLTRLLQALVACAGVTMKAVATSLGITLQDATVHAEGDIDSRGTLGIAKDAAVGFRNIRLRFDLDPEAFFRDGRSEAAKAVVAALPGPLRSRERQALGDPVGGPVYSRGPLLALALRMAGHRFVAERVGTPPVLVLDDVLSELDASRSDALVSVASPSSAS